MPKAEQLAIKQRGNDLCRIIPFKPLEGNYEFKISFLKNKYDIVIYKVFDTNPYICTLENPEGIEITYHRSLGDKPAKIQLKGIKTATNPQEWHRPLPLYNLVDPSTMDYFSIPIPFAKIEFPRNGTYKTYNSKAKKLQVIEMGTNNTIELFLCNKHFDYEQYSHAFHNMSLISIMFPIEYYATNCTSAPYFDKSDYSLDSEMKLASFFQLNSDMVIMCRHYANAGADSELEKPRISFIDNSRFLHVLAMTQISYPLPINGEYPHLCFRNATKENMTDNAALLIDVPEQCAMYHDIVRQHPAEDEKHEWLKLCTRLKRELLHDLREFALSKNSEDN